MDMSFTPYRVIGMMTFCSVAMGRSLVPNMRPMLGPYMSQSHRPTRAPVCIEGDGEIRRDGALAHAALAAGDCDDVLDPFDLRRRSPAPAAPLAGPEHLGRRWISISTRTAADPGMPPRTRSLSSLIACGTFGSFVARLIWTVIAAPSMRTPFTRPKEMMSRLKPG